MRLMGPLAASFRRRKHGPRPIGKTRSGTIVLPIAGGAGPLQNANAAEQRVGRNPQTTAEPAGGPYTRQTRVSRLFGQQFTAQTFSELISFALKPVPGNLVGLDLTVQATGGAKGGATVAMKADAPWSSLSNVQVIDAFGQPIISVSGYSLYLMNRYSGACGFWAPAASGPWVPTADINGNFSFQLFVPFEMFAGFCSIPAANASAVPSLRILLGASTEVYTTAPDTLPVLAVTVEEMYNSVGLSNPGAQPPDNGASHQWFEQPCATGVTASSSNDIQLPPFGGWLDLVLLVGRDANGVRSDLVLGSGATTQLGFWIDNVPEYLEMFGTRRSWMDKFYGYHDTGVLAYPYKQGAATFGPISALDTGDGWVDTNPGTILQFKNAGSGAFTGPGTLTSLSGRIYTPSGIPYTHLAE